MGEEHPKFQLSDHLAGTDKIASKTSQQVVEISEAVDKGADLSDHLAGTDKIASKTSQQVVEISEAVDKGAECSMVELLDELCRKNGRPVKRNNYYRRLQQVVQSKQDQHSSFQKLLQTRSSNPDAL